MAFGFRIKRTRADALFSDYIRGLADYTCERCHQEFERPAPRLHCSHYFSRKHRGTRFDRENAASLCHTCHRTFTEDPHDHREFFRKRLGDERLQALEVRAKTPTKVDEKSIAIALTLELTKMREERKVLK